MADAPPSTGAVTSFTAYKTEQLVGGSHIQAAVRISAQSVPSLIYFEFSVSAFGYTRDSGIGAAEGFAGGIEDVIGSPYVTTMAFRQDLNQAGNLIDQMEVFWSTDDGTQQGSVVGPLAAIQLGSITKCVQNDAAAFLGQAIPYPEARAECKAWQLGLNPPNR